MSLMDSMHGQGLAGTHQMYNGLIAAAGGEWSRALEVFLSMQCALVRRGWRQVLVALGMELRGGRWRCF